MARRSYKGTSVATTLAAGITSSDTTVALTDGSSFPTGTNPFVVTFDFGVTGEEKVLVTTRSGNTLSGITRGFDGTSAAAHAAGAATRHTLSATDLDEANAHVNATSNVHGVTGALTGTPPLYTGLVTPLSGLSISTYTQLLSAAYFTKFRAVGAVTVTAIYFNVAINYAGNMDVGIYADSAGVPGAKIVSSGSQPVPAGTGEKSLAIASTTLTAGTTYWLGIENGGSTYFWIYNISVQQPTVMQLTNTFPLPASGAGAALGSTAPLLYLTP